MNDDFAKATLARTRREIDEHILVLVAGMTVGTAFTLFVVPSLYVLMAKDHAKDGAAEMDEEMEGTVASVA